MKLPGRPLGLLFSLAGALILQVTTPSAGRLWTLSCFLIALFFWGLFFRSTYLSPIQARWSGSVMAIVLIVAVAFAPATSKDVNSYALYGRMTAEYHVSPYTHLPRDFAGDSWYKRTSAYWSDSPSVYGPVFAGVSDIVMKVAGTSYLTARLAFQLLAALSLVAAVLLLSRRIGAPLAIAAIGLNPLLVTFGANDAHCDVLIGLAVLCGVLAVEAKHYVVAGVALGVAALIKISLLPALFGAAVWLWFMSSRRAAIKTALAGAVVFCAGLLLAGGTSALGPLHRASLRHTRFSVWNPVHIVLTDVFGAGLPTHATADVLVSAFATVVVFGFGLFFLWRNRCNSSSVVAVCCLLVAYQLFGAYTLSWYAAWTIPAAALLLCARPMKPKLMAIVMGWGCWVAIAYLSGYAAIVVSVVLVALFVVRRLRGRPLIPVIVS